MHLTGSHMYVFNKNHTRMHLTSQDHKGTHLTGSHMYAFNRITRVCIKGSHVCIKQNHTCVHLTESHMYAFSRITHVCMCMYAF